MARKKAAPEHANHERWLVSYADFITLLFAFFVVMFASSQTDKVRAQMVSNSVKQALAKGGVAAAVRELLGGTVNNKGQGNAEMHGPGGAEKQKGKINRAELMPSMVYLSQALAAEIQQGEIEVHLEPRGLVLSLRQAAFFPSGGDAIDPRTFPALDKIGATIRGLPNNVRLEGHTDSVPIHTARFRNNWDLSAARAIAMMELLAKRSRISEHRMAIAGYADTLPVDTNKTEKGRAHNRRVDIVILTQEIAVATSADAEPRPTPHAAHK